jgi:hypothetical protein
MLNLRPFGPGNPSPKPFLPGHGYLKTGRKRRKRMEKCREKMLALLTNLCDPYPTPPTWYEKRWSEMLEQWATTD